jgi:SAM-dependent methyltransferase
MIPLLEAGHAVTGFDASPEMLEQCRASCAAQGYAPDLSLQRYEDFAYERRFAALILPVASFSLIGDFDTAAAVLRRFHGALEPDGRLIVDIAPLSGLAPPADDRRSWQAGNGDLLTLESLRWRTDWLAQSITYAIRYERWRNGVLAEAQLEPMTQRFWGVEEFRLLLAASGFAGITVTPDYRPGGPITAKTRLITYEAVRA